MVISARGGRAKPGHVRNGTVRISTILLAAVLAISLAAIPADARKRRSVHHSYSPPQSAMVFDAHSGKVLYASNIDEPRFPASITKVMTLYLVFEYLKEGKLKPEHELKVTANAAAQAPSKLDLKEGSEITVREAMYALVTKSANDAAVVIAENLAGSEENFARLMTRKARALGMTNTLFRNPSGLPDPEQHTTARDLIILAQRILADFPEHAKIFKTKVFSYGGEEFRNHNGLLFTYPGTEGLKTGFTHASGFNLLTSVRRNDKHLLAVVLGGPSARDRNARMRTLLNQSWGKAVTLASLRQRGAPFASAALVKAPEVAVKPPEFVKPQIAKTEAAPKLEAEQVADDKVFSVDDLPEPNPAFHPTVAERTLAVALASVGGLNSREAAQDPAPAQKVQAQAQVMQLTMAATSQTAGTTEAESKPDGGGTQADTTGVLSDQTVGFGPYHVQVGSYLSVAGAKDRLHEIFSKAQKLVTGHEELTVSGQVHGKSYYRARFGRFSETAAKDTCAKLKTMSIQCLVVRVE